MEGTMRKYTEVREEVMAIEPENIADENIRMLRGDK
jgi:hypothetical protein